MPKVDFYFHVWADGLGPVTLEAMALAQELPQTRAFVHEPFDAYLDLLNRDQPHTRNGTTLSWIGEIETEFVGRPRADRPFPSAPSYSQWRKVLSVRPAT